MNDEDKDLGGVYIGTRQIYEQLLKLTNEVDRLVSTLDHATDTTKDHEARIRVVEKWKYATSAALVVGLINIVIEMVRTLKP